MNRAEAWMCRMSGRSWWEAEYANGNTLAEWGTLTNTLLTPFGKGSTSRWEEVQKHQMVRLRLICPNGQAGELVDPYHDGHKFFQLKSAVRMVGNPHNVPRAHIIGLVLDPTGHCLCYAWEVAAARLISFEDNIYHFAFDQIGALSQEVQGLKV